MYLLDTSVVSELRKNSRTNLGVKNFFKCAENNNNGLYLSVITIGEIRRGIELIRHRANTDQATILELWLEQLITQFNGNIIDFTGAEAQVWGRLRVPNHENALDKQIAATALMYGLCVVTKNIQNFEGTGVEILNPFTSLT
jgi:toxin FitB